MRILQTLPLENKGRRHRAPKFHEPLLSDRPLAVRRIANRFSLPIAVAGIVAEAAGLFVGADR